MNLRQRESGRPVVRRIRRDHLLPLTSPSVLLLPSSFSCNLRALHNWFGFVRGVMMLTLSFDFAGMISAKLSKKRILLLTLRM